MTAFGVLEAVVFAFGLQDVVAVGEPIQGRPRRIRGLSGGSEIKRRSPSRIWSRALYRPQQSSRRHAASPRCFGQFVATSRDGASVDSRHAERAQVFGQFVATAVDGEFMECRHAAGWRALRQEESSSELPKSIARGRKQLGR